MENITLGQTNSNSRFFSQAIKEESGSENTRPKISLRHNCACEFESNPELPGLSPPAELDSPLSLTLHRLSWTCNTPPIAGSHRKRESLIHMHASINEINHSSSQFLITATGLFTSWWRPNSFSFKDCTCKYRSELRYAQWLISL